MTTVDDTTVEFETDAGRTGPVPLSALSEAAKRLRGEQLTFDVGAPRRDAPDFATIKIGGQLPVGRDLLYAEAVTVTVTDLNGEVIAEGPATVGWPAFKDKTSGEYHVHRARAHRDPRRMTARAPGPARGP